MFMIIWIGFLKLKFFRFFFLNKLIVVWYEYLIVIYFLFSDSFDFVFRWLWSLIGKFLRMNEFCKDDLWKLLDKWV